MGSLVPSDISLNFRFLFAEMSSSIGRAISEVLRNHSPVERIAQLAEYIDGLEAEKKKIEAFKRELPRCMLLLEITIVAVKEELTESEKSDVVPVLEEFMPLKKIAHEKHDETENSEDNIRSGDKMNWMSSVQLWNSDNQHLNDTETSKPENIKSCKNRIAGTAFWPFKRCTYFPVLPVVEENGDESTVVPGLSLGTPEANNRLKEMNSSAFSSKSSCSRSGSNVYTDNRSGLMGGEQQSPQITRKQRRCWSPELHRRFVDALQQLGGAQAATPKQIRELMQVDGLSNDEVKSHLQKYRIHTRRVNASTNGNHPTVLGASWMLSQEQVESSKQRNSQSGSPQCHTHLAEVSRATSLTGGDSVEDEDDEKSVSLSWKNEIQLSLGDSADVKMGRVWL